MYAVWPKAMLTSLILNGFGIDIAACLLVIAGGYGLDCDGKCKYNLQYTEVHGTSTRCIREFMTCRVIRAVYVPDPKSSSVRNDGAYTLRPIRACGLVTT